ncbi:hypothetical protein BHM03_00022262, partial [Ensete ventricosum]
AVVAGGRPCRRQPLRAVPLPADCLPTDAELGVGRPLRAGRGRSSADRWQQPLRRGCGCRVVVGRPFAWGPWLQPPTPLQVAGHPCKGAGRGHAREIVYPCIPDPDGEDEGGQASSSLAVSTRWISAAKLLQSGLATLAQREGGE